MSIRSDEKFMRLLNECLEEYLGDDFSEFYLKEEALIDYIDQYVLRSNVKEERNDLRI